MAGSGPARHLGPYALHEEIGRGGMGVVWRGRHLAHGEPVAIKVLLGGATATRPEFVAAFKQEARAVGRLHHPNIVSVLDYGIVPAAVETATYQVLAGGQPYLVMEWLDGITLDRGMGPQSFDDLAQLLLGVLDALAHAHARGVLHRDIKASNIVVAPDGSIRLIDFGIARLDAPDIRDEQFQGTVSSMAPEQVDPDRRRDQGPATDLYGLGCLAFKLSAGRLPFLGATMLDFLNAHLHEAVPPLEPIMAVPPRFEAWLRCLLAKDPRARFRCAADAARALVQLQSDRASVPRTVDPPRQPRRQERTIVMSTLGTVIELVDDVGLSADGGFVSAQPDALTEWPRPAIPATWRRDMPLGRSSRTGAGIFRMRTIPMVDRESERDAVWDALRRAVTDQRAEIVILRGTAGCGKSRVAQWTMERAVELGAAQAMTAWHCLTESELSGPISMLARFLKCTGLSWQELQLRVKHVLEPLGATGAEIQAAAEVLRAVVHDDMAAVDGSFASEGERVAVLADVLELLSKDRPMFLWLDDVQWGRETLQLVERLLTSERLPLVGVLTIRDEALADAPREASVVADLEGHPCVRTIVVQSLEERHSTQLVEAMLGLEHDVARRVVRRSRGNPLFAVQLVGDLLERGLVEPDAAGHYVLSPAARGEPFALADDIHEVWVRRTQQLLAKFRGKPCPRHPRVPGAEPCTCAQDAFEIAAVLGQEVASEIWRQVCEQAGVAWTRALLEGLLEDNLALEEAEGFRFEHGLLRESLEQEARDRGVLARHHLACARTLATAPRPDPERLVAHRRARAPGGRFSVGCQVPGRRGARGAEAWPTGESRALRGAPVGAHG